MFKDRWWLLLLTGMLAFVVFGGFIFACYPPGTGTDVRVRLSQPLQHTEGFEYQAVLPSDITRAKIASDQDGRGMSPLTLWEDGRRLAPDHAFRSRIQRAGKGANLHWGNTVYFSTSDNTDPRVNGRSYAVQRTAGLPLGVYIAILTVGYVLALALIMTMQRLLADTRWGTPLMYACVVGVTIVALELAAWILVENQLASYGSFVGNLYRKAFSVQSASVTMPPEPGRSPDYAPHHYLNYALNPDVAYCGVRQFNAQYLIRRSEPIAPDKGDRWRILIIGGSTTFAEGIPREQDTWPYLLEERIRAQCNPRCEVINCGVGGYSLLENFIHYIILLRDLKPDVVLFYTGINDVQPRLFNDIRSDYSNYRIPWRTEGTHFLQPNTSLAFSYLYRYYFVNKVLLRTLYEGIGGLASRKGSPPSAWAAALARNSEQTYRHHMDDFIRLLMAQGIKVAILPQVFAGVNEREKVFGLGVEQHNRVNEELAKEHGLPYAAGLLEPGVFRKQDLQDSCHFSEAGCQIMEAVVFEFLKKNGLLPHCLAK